MGSMSNSKAMMGSSSSTLKKLPLSSLNSTDGDRTPIKKKNTMTTKKASATNGGSGFSSELDFSKQRKNSVLIGGTKDE
tara:strand:- start:502 stop:738 length:237 start_codon:yes stop_codon:yes gene_type:complete